MLLPSVYPLLLLLATTFPGISSTPIAAGPPKPQLDPLILPLGNVTLTPATVNDNPIIDYRVPNTAISLKIQTGAALSSVAIRNTLIACRGQIARSIYNWGTVSEIDPDPYVYPPKGTRSTGVELVVYSMNVKETGHLEWLQLDAVVQGLLDTLVGHAEYKQAHFVVFDSTKRPKEQGRGKLSNVREGVGVEVQ